MTPRTVLLLWALGIASLGAGWWLGPGSVQAALTALGAGQPAFPGLVAKLQDAAKVEVTSQGHAFSIVRGPGGWGLAEKGGYPVRTETLRALLTGLTELRLVEPRTSDPAQFERLGLGDPSRPGSSAIQVRVLDGAGTPLAALVLGHRRVRAGAGPEEIYVRRPDEARTWLAEGHLAAESDPMQWVERDVMSVDAAKVTSVAVSRGDERLEFARADGKPDGKPELAAPAEHPKLDESKLADVFRGLEYLAFTDVRPGPDLPGTPLGHAEFRTADGASIGVDSAREGDSLWLRLAASGGELGPKLAPKLKGWVFKVGDWKERSLAPSLDLLKPAEAAPAGGGGATPLPPGLAPPGAPPAAQP